jgi:hypothetical protein
MALQCHFLDFSDLLSVLQDLPMPNLNKNQRLLAGMAHVLTNEGYFNMLSSLCVPFWIILVLPSLI